MKKLLYSLVILGCSVISAFAQKTPDGGRFSIGIEAGLPVGDASEAFSVALGVSIKYEHRIIDNTFITGSAGYSNFLYKGRLRDALRAAGHDKSGDGFIPLKAGLKYYFNTAFFVEGQVGVAISTFDGGDSAFAYAPGLGYSFDSGFEASVRYEAWSHYSTISQVGLHLAYRF
jgi:hypothetical protein